MDNEEVFRLAKPRKKGILSFIFSRFLIIAVLLGLQVAMYVMFFLWLRKYLSYFYLTMAVFTLIMTIYLFMSEIDNSAKLTWLLLIVALPILGATLLLYTQINLGHRVLQQRAEEQINKENQ